MAELMVIPRLPLQTPLKTVEITLIFLTDFSMGEKSYNLWQVWETGGLS